MDAMLITSLLLVTTSVVGFGLYRSRLLCSAIGVGLAVSSGGDSEMVLGICVMGLIGLVLALPTRGSYVPE